MQKTILDANHLSYKEIFDLCQEFISWLPDDKKPGKMPNIKISINNTSSCDFRNYWKQLFKIIDKYTQTKHNICRTEKDFNPIKDLGLILPLRNFENSLTGAGALNSEFYKFIYYFDYKCSIRENYCDNYKNKSMWNKSIATKNKRGKLSVC